MEFIPAYFEIWHLPVVFAAGVAAAGYGSVIGSGGILTQFVLVTLGMPIHSAVATYVGGTIGMNMGGIVSAPRKIWDDKKLLAMLSAPFVIGAIIGAQILLQASSEFITYAIIVGLVAILFYSIFRTERRNTDTGDTSISWIEYPFVVATMGILGVYGAISNVGGGTFQKLALVGILRIKFVEGMALQHIVTTPGGIAVFLIAAYGGIMAWPYVITLWIGNYIGTTYAFRVAKRIPERYLRVALIALTVCYLAYLTWTLL